MKARLKFVIYRQPKIYSTFEIIGIKFINTYQSWAINITLFNLFFQIRHDKELSFERQCGEFKEGVPIGECDGIGHYNCKKCIYLTPNQ